MLTAMTFNILVDKPESLFPWTARREYVVSAIKKENPDVLCVQEALAHQREYLENNLLGYEAFGVGRNDGEKEGEQTVIFHKKVSLQKIEQGVFWLSETPGIAGSIGWDAKRPRTVSWKLLKTNSNEKFYVLNTHFDHKGNQANIKSAQVIFERINSWETDYPVLLCGDFNSPVDSESYQALLNAQFKDIYSIASGNYPYTYHMFHVDEYNDQSSRRKRMETHHRVFRRIDHIFTRGSISVSDIHINNADCAGQYPSDHFPVICNFEMIPLQATWDGGVNCDNPATLIP